MQIFVIKMCSNLNKVECKWICKYKNSNWRHGSNLNKVECKLSLFGLNSIVKLW